MQAPKITRIIIPGSNYQTGRSAKIDQITFHHIVGDAQSAISRFQDRNQQVSSTYIISSNGTIYQCIDEKDTPYTDANFVSNSRAITIEHAGGTNSVPYTEAMYQASIMLCAWIRSRYNITRFMRHKQVSITPTDCPGRLNVERIVNESAKETEMPLTSTQQDKFIKMALLREPTPSELSNQEWAKNPGELSDTLWENGGKQNYESRLMVDDILNFMAAVYKIDVSDPSAREIADKLVGLGWKGAMYELAKRYQDEIVSNTLISGGYTDKDRATANETNNIVKSIWQKVINLLK